MAKCGVRVWNSLIVRARVRIGIQTWGSEGDIRPFVALGHALASRGHDVEMLYTEISDRRYDAVARSLGFTARAVASPIITDEAYLYEIGLKILNARDPLQQGLMVSKYMLEPVMAPMYEAGLDLARRSDLLVHHYILHAARAAADITGTPAITVAFAHLLMPSREITPQGMPRLGTWGNVIAWKLASAAINLTMRKDANRLRKRLGLPLFRNMMEEGWPSHRLNLIASSPALLDRPADWPPWHQMCGFLALPPHEHEPVAPEVEAFLSRGPAPVFMGFGSLMPLVGSDHLMDAIAILIEAARQSGQRAIIQADDRAAAHRRCVVCKADAARGGVSALRRRGASRRRGDHAQHATRGRAVGHRAAYCRSIRVVGRSTAAGRSACPTAPHEMERERPGGAHSPGDRESTDEGRRRRDSETHGLGRWSGHRSRHD